MSPIVTFLNPLNFLNIFLAAIYGVNYLADIDFFINLSNFFYFFKFAKYYNNFIIYLYSSVSSTFGCNDFIC